MENTEGNGGPQADFVGKRELSRIDRELKEMGPQADCFGERQLENENGPRRTRREVRKRTLWGNVNYRK